MIGYGQSPEDFDGNLVCWLVTYMLYGDFLVLLQATFVFWWSTYYASMDDYLPTNFVMQCDR